MYNFEIMMKVAEHPDYAVKKKTKAFRKYNRSTGGYISISHKKFRGKGCSLCLDKNGYFVRTHRARSKSYKTPESIPDKDIKFIESTG